VHYYCTFFTPGPSLADLETPAVSLPGLLELLVALEPQLEQSPGLIPLLAEELRRELAAHQGVES
jgi:hypothetical protein